MEPQPFEETAQLEGPELDPSSAVDGPAYDPDLSDSGLVVPPPAPSHPRRRIAIAAIAVVVIVVLALLFLGLLGVHQIGPIQLPGSSGSGPAEQSFSAAYGSANQTAAGESGGPWLLVEATGVDGENVSASFSTGSTANCGPASPALENGPASEVGQGLSPDWEFGFVSADGQQTLEIAVIGGSAQVESVEPASHHCLTGVPVGHLAPVSGIEDSPAAVASLGTNLSNFEAKYPGGLAYLLLSDAAGEIGSQSGTAIWLVLIEPCPSTGSTSHEPPAGDPNYEGAVNGTSDRMLASIPNPGIGYCESPGSLGSKLGFGTPTPVYTVGGFTYRVEMTSVGAGLTLSDLTPVLVPPAVSSAFPTPVDPAEVNLTVTNITGSTIAQYSFTSGSWTSGGSVTLTPADGLVVTSTVDLADTAIVMVANAPLTGEVGFDL